MKQNWVALAFQLMQLGFLIALPLVGGLLVGLWADNSLGTKPLFILLGALAGIAAGTLAMYRVISQAIAQAEASDRLRKGGDATPPRTDTDTTGDQKEKD
ncbi:MAG: AtpZ/AtpI family protein [Chloroflexi bacterium]|nr:AtpZ/AtpI family protein [Chloroflexota bacterium]